MKADILVMPMPVARRTFRWTQTYSVHIAMLDEQHRILVDTVGELDEALSRGDGNAVVEAVLQKLVIYAGEHFAAEESLMAEYDFPGLPSHCAKHREFRERIGDFLEGLKAGKRCVSVSVLLFLDQWLKEHLLKTDRQYSAFLNARGVH